MSVDPDKFFTSSAEPAAGKAPDNKRPRVNPDDFFSPLPPPPPPPPPSKWERLKAFATDATGATGGLGDAAARPMGRGLEDAILSAPRAAKPAPKPASSYDQGPRTAAESLNVGVDAAAKPLPSDASPLDRPDPTYGPSMLTTAEMQQGSIAPEAFKAAQQAAGRRAPPEARAVSPGQNLVLAAGEILRGSGNPVLQGAASGFSQLGQVGTGAVRLAADLAGAKDVAEFAGAAGRKAEAAGTLATSNLTGNAKLVADVTSSIINSVPSVAIGMGGGPALRTLFATSAMQEYGNGRDAGFDVGESLARAGIYGTAEALGERFGFPEQIQLLKSVTKRLPSGELAKVFGSMLAKEVPGEQLTTAAQFLADKIGPAALAPGSTWDDYLNAAGETMKVTIGQTAIMGGGPAALGVTRNALAKADRVSALTPQQIISESMGRFDQLAAASGLDPAAAEAAKKRAAALPADQVPGFLKRAADAFSKRGLFRAPADTTILDQATGPPAAAAGPPAAAAAPGGQPAVPESTGGVGAPAEPVNGQSVAAPQDSPPAAPFSPAPSPSVPGTSPTSQDAPEDFTGLDTPTAAGPPAAPQPGEPVVIGTKADGTPVIDDGQGYLRTPDGQFAPEPDVPVERPTDLEAGLNQIGQALAPKAAPPAAVAGPPPAAETQSDGAPLSAPPVQGATLHLDRVEQGGVAPAQAGGGPIPSESAQAAAPSESVGAQAAAPSESVGAQAAAPSESVGAQPSAAPGAVLQNRNRSTPAAIAQMRDIAARPDYTRLGFSRDFTAGAPVVAGGKIPAEQMGREDRAAAGDRQIPVRYAVVEAGDVLASNSVDGSPNPDYGQTGRVLAIAGNGRIAGLQAAYQGGSAEQYRQGLAEDDLHGVDPKVIAGMKSPVLVRVMPESEITPDIGDVSNRGAGLALSAVEQANNDARRINLDALEFSEDGEVTPQTVRRFVQAMPQAEQGNLINKDGSPTRQAIDRLNAAIFAEAYENDALVELYAQAVDPEARNVISALAQVAPQMARLKGAGALDIRDLVAQAAELAVNATRRGIKIAQAAKQADLDADSAALEVLRLFADNVRAVKPVVEALRNAAEFAHREAIKSGADMFGEVQKAERRDVLDQLRPENERRRAQDLGQPGRGAPDANDAGRQRAAAEGPGDVAPAQSRRTTKARKASQAQGVTNAPQEVPKQAGVRAEHQDRDQGGQAPEAGLSHSVQREAPSAGQAQEGLTLEPQTEADLRAKAEREAAAAKADAAEQKRLADKAKADAEVGGFALSGSDRAADVGAAAGQADIFSAPEKTTPSAEVSSSPAEAKPAQRIEDTGEKIAGARKDYAAKLKDAMEVDIAAEPLSKSWPEPDYAKLLEGGADPFVVAWVHASRDEIPTKPQKAWKLKGWVQTVELLRSLSKQLLDGTMSKQTLATILSGPETARIRTELGSRADLYQAVGHDQSLKGVRVSMGQYSIYKGVTYSPPMTMWAVEKQSAASAFGNWPRELATGKTKEEAIANFKKAIEAKGDAVTEKKPTGFVIWRDSGKYVVGKKVGKNYVTLKTFDDLKAARAHIASSAAELEAALERYKSTPFERKTENAPRVGADHRNGARMTPGAFQETFGWRGVQWGNYVEQSRRQQDLDRAYDSLMDLSGVIGVPARALSLNGTLGLAFGARGKGGKNAPAAHYEPSNVVINLTKEHGAGSLAHEWLHGADNYFAKLEGGPGGMMTEGARNAAVRPEMVAAWDQVSKAIRSTQMRRRSMALDKRRSKPYWATPDEMAARAFEAYIIAKLQDQGAANDYLANIVSEKFWQAQDALLGHEGEDTYPYPTESEMGPIREAFDNFFRVVEAKTDEATGNVALLSTTPFYSALQRAIASSPMKAGEAGKWKTLLRGMVQSGKVKQDEVTWSGLEDWLDLQDGKVAREAIGEYLAANGVRVEETVLGAPSGRDVYQQRMREMSDEELNDEALESNVEPDDYGSREEIIKAILDSYEQDMGNAMSREVDQAKFGQYTLPGGTNYREVLLTLPAKTKPDWMNSPSVVAARAEFLRKWPDGMDTQFGLSQSEARKQREFNADRTRYVNIIRASEKQAEASAGIFSSAHWVQPNVLAHLRLNDRTDADGNRVLFVEELQSDWQSEARKKGFAAPPGEQNMPDLLARAQYESAGEGSTNWRWRLPDGTGGLQPSREAAERAAAEALNQRTRPGVPRAPFIDTTDKWLTLALKRIVKLAVDEGYDRVAFVTGEQSADRYDLSKQVDSISWRKNGATGRTVAVELPSAGVAEILTNADGKIVGVRGARDVFANMQDRGLDEAIGKELAQKIMAEPEGTLTGEGLKVGGEGMRAFYDKIVPSAMNSLLKKLGGGKMEMVEIRTSDAEANPAALQFQIDHPELYGEDTRRLAEQQLAGRYGGQPGFQITDAMRAAASEGLPLFREGSPGAGMSKAAVQSIVDRASANWAYGGPKVTVVASASELPATEQHQLRKMGALNTVRGMMLQDGRTFLIADRLQDEADAQFVLFHEVLGHYGLRAFLQDDYARMMGALRMANPKLAAKANAWYGALAQGTINALMKSGLSRQEAEAQARLIAVEEALADRAGRGENVPKLWQRVMAALQRALRRMGLGLVADKLEAMTEAETFALLGNARKAVQAGMPLHVFQGEGAALSDMPRVSQTETPEFKRWFGDSKVVDAEGKPLVVYRGEQSGEEVTVFDPRKTREGGFFFTPDKNVAASYARNGELRAFYIKAEKVLDLTRDSLAARRWVAKWAKSFDEWIDRQSGEEVDPFDVIESGRLFDYEGDWSSERWIDLQLSAKADGYDMLIAPDTHDGVFSSYIVFDPKNIKSVFNRGTFDPTSPDILLSVVPPSPDPLESFRRKAGMPKPVKFGDRIKAGMESVRQALRSKQDFWDAFRVGTLDTFYGTQRLEKMHLHGLPLEQSAYVTQRLANGGTSAVVHAMLMHGQARWTAGHQHLEKIPGTKGLLDILAPLGDNLNDWFSWMIANRAARLMKEGRERNFTEDEIKAGQALATPERAAAFKQAAVEYAAFKRSVLDIAEQAGLIDKDGRKAWDYADYIPFYRQVDDQALFSPTGRKGLAGQSSGIRRLRGGEASLNDPMENLLMNISRLVDASLKNNALVQTIGLFEPIKGLDVVKKVGYDIKPAMILANEVKAVLEKHGTPPEVMDVIPDEVFGGIAKMWSIVAPTDPDVVRVMVKGKPAFYRVNDPLLLKAFTGFVPFDFPGLPLMRAAKRLLTNLVTATPEFWARNWIRDSIASQAISREGFNPLNSIKGIASSMKESGFSEDMLFAGASFEHGQTTAGDPEKTAISIRRALRAKGQKATALDWPARFFEAYQDVGNAIENANRVAVGQAVLKSGGSVAQAAYESKDLMDFNLRGKWALYQVAADVLPFFNARVQGLYRLGRADPKRLAAVGGLMLLMTAMLALANYGEDWYEELPDYDKDLYWHIKIGDAHIRIPKPFELGVLFATIPERISRSIAGLDSGRKTVSRVWANMRDQLAFDPMPQLFRPAADVANNRDTFRDRPLESLADQNVLPSKRASESTSATAKVIAQELFSPLSFPLTEMGLTQEAFGLSPKKIEHLVNGYFGTVGTWALAASDLAVRSATDAPERPASRMDDLPLVRAFYRQDPARATVFESDLYAMRAEIDDIVGSYRKALKAGDQKEAARLMERYRDRINVRGTVIGATDRMAAMSKERDLIYRDEKLTPDQKRERIDKLQAERNKVAREAAMNQKVRAAF